MEVKRSFIIGDSWLYYKIYSGAKTSDTVLTDIINPVVSSLIEDKIVEKWFFIRYRDPKHHIRVRFNYHTPENLYKIIDKLQPYLEQLVNQDLIWKVQTDSYHRELERYGANTMEHSETLFYYDSELIVNFLEMIEGDEGEELRWKFALRCIDTLLKTFKYTLVEKINLLERLKNGFGQEFGMNRFLKKQLDDKYRNERTKIELFLNLETEEPQEYSEILNILNSYKNNINPIAETILNHKKLETLLLNLDDLLSSYIHMTMNRLFKSNNRMHEMVCYDFMYRYYKSALARHKSKSKKNA